MSTRAPNVTVQKFPNRLREWRKHRGLSLEKLGETVGYSANTVSKHETGGYEVTVAQLEEYARALDVKAELLLGEGSALPPDMRALFDLASGLTPSQLNVFVRQGAAFKESNAAFLGEAEQIARRARQKKKT